MQKLDTTQWPKVEGDTFPEDGQYWHSYGGIHFAMHSHAKGDPIDRGDELCKVDHYGPIEFATNDAPETVTLYEISSEQFEGKKWALKDTGDGMSTTDGFWVGKDDYTEHRTQTYVKQAATAG